MLPLVKSRSIKTSTLEKVEIERGAPTKRHKYNSPTKS